MARRRGQGAAMSRREVLLLLLLAAGAVAMLPLASGKPSPRAFKINITMPANAPTSNEEDAYVCTTLPLPAEPAKLVGIEPLARQEVVHHILLFGCGVPAVTPGPGEQPVWDCKAQRTCGGFEETVLYGWGRNAPKLELPDGVGFSVGGTSSIRYIVAQIHYLKPKPPGDTSGVSLTLQPDPVPFSAGMLSYASWFTIPPRQKEYLVPNSCCYRGFQPLDTFAVRVHTHGMGRAVVMTRPAGNGTGLEVVAQGDPLKPQGFNPVTRHRIFPGDPLRVTCLFDSSNVDHPVSAGPTHEHEMCNMYLMVYSALPHIEMCNDGESLVSDAQPGSLPQGARVKADASPGWKPPLPTDKRREGVLGDVTSVSIGPDGTLWALHRGGAVWDAATFDAGHRLARPKAVDVDVVVQMEADTGKVLRQWGAGHFYMPHMLTLDRDGNVWVADVGRHQVLKFSPEGKLLLEVGTKLEPGSDGKHFCKPTQVAFLRDGSFIVSDGYCNARAARFTASGAYKDEYSLAAASGKGGALGQIFGSPDASTPSEISVAHSVVVDECTQRLYLADREGARVLTFDLATKQLLQLSDLSRFGRVWALHPGPYGHVVALAWEKGRDAALVEVSQYQPDAPLTWTLPDSSERWPHDLAIGAAPLALSGAGDRLFAVYYAPLCSGASCGPVRKAVLFPSSYKPPAAGPPKPKSGKPVLAHLGGHHDDGKAAAAAAAGKEAAAAGEAAPSKQWKEEEEEAAKEENAWEAEAAGGKEQPESEEEKAEDEEEAEEDTEREQARREEAEDDGPEAEEEAKAEAPTPAPAAKQSAKQPAAAAPAALKGSSSSSGAQVSGGGGEEVHETLRARRGGGAGGGGKGSLWLSLGQVAIAASVLAAFVAAAAYKLLQSRRGGGGAQRGHAASGSELAKLNGGGGYRAVRNGGYAANGGGGAAALEAGDIIFGPGGGGRGGSGNGNGSGAFGGDEDDLERLEREMLLRGAAASSAPAGGRR